MNKTPFQRFIDLILFDQDLYKKEQEIIALETEIEVLEEYMNNLKDICTQQEHMVHDARKQVDQQELEMKVLDEKMKDIQVKFAAARNNKEYLALKKELDEVQQQQTMKEQAVIAAWNALENIQKTSVQKCDAAQKDQEDYTKKIENQWQKVEALEQTYAEKSALRKDLEIDIPQEWRDRYHRMRNSVADPIATVDGTSCKACYQEISHHDMAALNRNVLLQCKGCFRFLYGNYQPSVSIDFVGK